MLTCIIHQSPKLVTFFEGLALPLTEPQRRHLANLSDAILVAEGEKTLSNLQRQFVEAPDPSNMADFLRISPWPTETGRTDCNVLCSKGRLPLRRLRETSSSS